MVGQISLFPANFCLCTSVCSRLCRSLHRSLESLSRTTYHLGYAGQRNLMPTDSLSDLYVSLEEQHEWTTPSS